MPLQFLLPFVFLLADYCIMQGQSAAWLQSVGGPGGEAIEAAAVDTAAGRILAGGSFDAPFSWQGFQAAPAGNFDVFLAQLDAAGKVEWLRHGGSNGIDETNFVCSAPGGNRYWGGSYWLSARFGTLVLNAAGSSKSLFILQLDSQGNIRWGKSIDGTGYKEAGAATATPDGGLILTGSFSDTLRLDQWQWVAQAAQDFFIIRLDDRGAVQWSYHAGLEGVARGKGLAIGTDGTLTAAGQFSGRLAIGADTLATGTPGDDLWIARWDDRGNPLWARRAGGPYESNCRAVALDDAGNSYVAGDFLGVIRLNDQLLLQSQGFNYDGFALSYQPDGTPRWARRFGGARDDGVRGMAIRGSDISLTGTFRESMGAAALSVSGQGSSDNGFWLLVNAEGTAKSLFAFTGVESILPGQVLAFGRTSWVLGGAFSGAGRFGNAAVAAAGQFDGFLGIFETGNTAVGEAGEATGMRVYPNPANGWLQVVLPETENGQAMEIVDSRGQTVFRGAFDPSPGIAALPAGWYLLRVFSGRGRVLSAAFVIGR